MKKERKRHTLEMNKARGSLFENIAMARSEAMGREVKRTGRGSDYVERKINPITGKKGKPTYVEVKTGRARLSPLQKKEKVEIIVLSVSYKNQITNYVCAPLGFFL
ncbi:MAG: hypothetical protein QXF35_03980 [Candidatus Bilamarchaeaceae archaeon]